MAKRFTDTQKYHKPFIRGLEGPYKLLWDFLYCECDHAGIWIVDFEIAQILIGKDMPINKEDALKYFNDGEERIIEIDEGKKWFIPSFITFQYGILNPGNRAHRAVILILKKYNLQKCIKGLISPLEGCKDMDMDKDKDKEGEYEGEKFVSGGGYKSSDLFETFFDSYSKITGNNQDKDAAFREWKSLSQDERILAMKMIQAYFDDCTHNKRIVKMAKSYLKDKTFKNDFSGSSKYHGGKPKLIV